MSTGARLKVFVASSPPKPAPSITTLGFDCGMVTHKMEYGGYAPAMTGRPDQLRQAADLRRDNVHFGSMNETARAVGRLRRRHGNSHTVTGRIDLSDDRGV